MSGFFSGLTRAIWTFVVLCGAAVLAVAATDDPRAWMLLSARGVAAIAVASLVIGWLIRSRGMDAGGAPARVRPRAVRRAAVPTREKAAERREPALTAGPRDPEPEGRPVLRATRPVRPVRPAARAEPAAAVPEANAPEEHAGAQETGMRIRIPPPTGNGDVDRCFDVAGLGERKDLRRWQDQARLVEARRLRRSDDREAALERLREIRAQYPDYDQVYVWSAEALDRAGRAGERDAVLMEGLVAARSKAAVLAALGAYAAEEGRLAEAVEWLVRSAALQLGGGGETASWAFLDLAALSEPHKRLAEAGAWLYAQADRIDARGIRLADDFLEERRALSREGAEAWMLEAIETLWRFYGSEAEAEAEAKAPPSPRPTLRSSPLRAERRHRPRALQ